LIYGRWGGATLLREHQFELDSQSHLIHILFDCCVNDCHQSFTASTSPGLRHRLLPTATTWSPCVKRERSDHHFIRIRSSIRSIVSSDPYERKPEATATARPKRPRSFILSFGFVGHQPSRRVGIQFWSFESNLAEWAHCQSCSRRSRRRVGVM
jgi:hypothetical protein